MTALNRHRMTVDMLTAVTPGSLKTVSRPGGAKGEQLPCPKDAADRSISMDPYLGHFRPIIEARYDYFLRVLKNIEESEGGLEPFSRGYESMGIQVVPEGIRYREWAPGAVSAHFFGDFSIYLCLMIYPIAR